MEKVFTTLMPILLFAASAIVIFIAFRATYRLIRRKPIVFVLIVSGVTVVILFILMSPGT